MAEDEKKGKGESGRIKDESFKLWQGLPRPRDPEARRLKRPMSWKDALSELMAGNRRFIGSKNESTVERTPERRMEVADEQTPFAVILSCADSRVSPEIIFDQWIGDLFVVRIAGNIVNPPHYGILGSIEYGVAALGANLVIVLGHSRCGAVTAAVQAVETGMEFPGSIASIIDTITPAVKNAQKMPGDLLLNSVRENVRLSVEKIETASPVLTPLIKSGTVKVIGGKYDLITGEVTLFTDTNPPRE